MERERGHLDNERDGKREREGEERER